MKKFGPICRARSISERRRHDARGIALQLGASTCGLVGAAFAVGSGGRWHAQSALFAEPEPDRRCAFDLFSDGRIWPHLEATFTAALGGLALGIAVGVVLGVAAALVRLVAELLEPVMTL